MHPTELTPASESSDIEKHILTDLAVSKWLKSAFESALHRDPVDALHDAEVLLCALRTRAQCHLTKGLNLPPPVTSMLLRQHADSLSELSEACLSPGKTELNFRCKQELSDIARQVHTIARNLAQ